jgi:hypothetical protein
MTPLMSLGSFISVLTAGLFVCFTYWQEDWPLVSLRAQWHCSSREARINIY